MNVIRTLTKLSDQIGDISFELDELVEAGHTLQFNNKRDADEFVDNLRELSYILAAEAEHRGEEIEELKSKIENLERKV